MGHPRGDWKVGSLATKTWDGQKGSWRYDLTPEGQKLFDDRVGADLNPAGLVRQNHPSLYRTAKRRLGSAAVSAAGWVGLWRAILSYNGKSSLSGWARKWARRELQEQLRQVGGLEATSLVESEKDLEGYQTGCGFAVDHAMNRPGWTPPSPERALEATEQREVLRTTMRKLPPAEFAVLSCWLEGFAKHEIAKRLGFSQQVTTLRLKNGTRRLAARPELQSYFLET